MSIHVDDELTVDDLHALTTMVREVLNDACTPEALADPEHAADGAWRALSAVGVTRLGLPEGRGGDDGSLLAATEVARVVGECSAPGPLVETSMLAGWLIEAAGVDQPEGPTSTGPSTLTARSAAGTWHVRGTVRQVPVISGTTVVAVAAGADGAELLVVLPSDAAGSPGHNLARERRDTYALDLTDAAVHPLPAGSAHELRLRGALSRTLLTAGALRRIRERTIAYAGERVQFGRPIASFQAVQHQLARLAAEAAAVDAAADQAVRTALRDGFADPRAELLVAAAKVRSAEAANVAAAIAHQVHAALGMSQEHPLHHSTTRLWSWRSEWGSEASWAEDIADRATAAGPRMLWPFLTGER